jgi:FkbM family methyltransferase
MVMWLLAKFAGRLRALARYIENPSLYILRRRGAMIDTYQELAQPWFRDLRIATVLDIGANTGSFAVTIHALLPNAQIYSFEPLVDCFDKLQMRMKDAQRFTAFNVAIGAQVGELEFQRNNYLSSSSFLRMTTAHTDAYPFTRHSRSVMVKVERLDTIAEKLVITDPLLIKIDVQGYEDHVLRGGQETMRRAKLVIIETSFVTLYEGQPLFDDIYHDLVNLGFTYIGSLDRHIDSQTGQVLQVDSVFIKYN